MSKKVGVVTLTGGANYGNKLQHYAVLRVLERMGYEADSVRDLTRSGFAEPAEHIPLMYKLRPKYLKASIESRLQYKYHRKNPTDGVLRCIRREKRHHAEYLELEHARLERFNAFTRRYLPFGELTVSATRRTDAAAVTQYLAFVCGSDQVWNPNYRDTSPLRFLSFAPEHQRIALSPSFGVAEIPAKRREIYARLLAEIPWLSVREDTGRRIIRELTGREAPVLIDPTLMLSARDWDELAHKPQGFADEPYLLCYFLGGKSRKSEGDIKSFAQKRGLRIIELVDLASPEHYCYDPAEFLWLIKNAAAVCTDSFHGTVFSILYHKQFLTFPRNESGFSKDSRTGTLLRKLELTDAVYQNGAEPKACDYDRTELRLAEERKAFWAYLENALQACSAAHNAYKPKPEPAYRNVWERNRAVPAHCNACGACAKSCPAGALSLRPDSEGFLYPMVNEELCTACGACLALCKRTEQLPKAKSTTAYAYVNGDEAVRKNSSSGGAFWQLAQDTLKSGGVVFGARFTEDFRLVHAMAETPAEAEAFMGSKYLQSELGNSFEQVKAQLETDRAVLFSGTPCQVAGLKAYLGRDYEKLVTVDIICHGVPSQKALTLYLGDRTRVGKPVKLSFRNKDKGWARFSLKLKGRRGSYRRDLESDPYLIAFLRNLNLRHSCYDCRFKTRERCSDITLADFWGVGRVLPKLADDGGVSLLLCHSEKGLSKLQTLSSGGKLVPVDVAKALGGNGAAEDSVLMPAARKEFYPLAERVGFTKALKLLYPMTAERRIYRAKDALHVIYRKLKGG